MTSSDRTWSSGRAWFWYGCASTVAAVCLYVSTVAGYNINMNNPTPVVVVFIVHGLVFGCTGRVFFRDVPAALTVTPPRIRFARITLVIVLLLFLGHVALVAFSSPRIGLFRSNERMLWYLSMTLAALFLLTSLHILFVWAFRLESVFGPGLTRAIFFPGYILGDWQRRRARIRRRNMR